MEETKMPIEIRETIVTPADDDHDIVEIHISDAPPDDESATFVVRILSKQRALATPTLAHLQRAAMKIAQDEMTALLRDLARELQQNGQALEPAPKNPRR
jgi:hypothetical protein